MTLRIKKFHHSQPIAGYTFPVDGTLIVGKNPKEAIAKITEYRENNGLPLGDPEADLAAHIAKKMPWLVEDVDSPSPDEEGSEEHLARDYISQIWKTAPNAVVEIAKQKKRYACCLECKHYAPLLVDDETIRRSTALAAGLLEDIVDGEDHGFCEHHLWVCSVACSLKDQKGLANPEAFKTCWLDEETKKEN